MTKGVKEPLKSGDEVTFFSGKHEPGGEWWSLLKETELQNLGAHCCIVIDLVPVFVFQDKRKKSEKSSNISRAFFPSSEPHIRLCFYI